MILEGPCIVNIITRRSCMSTLERYRIRNSKALKCSGDTVFVTRTILVRLHPYVRHGLSSRSQRL